MTGKRTVIVLLFAFMLVFFLVFPRPTFLQVIQGGITPGPEGVVLDNYGFHFAAYSNSFHTLGTFGTDTTLESGRYREYNWALRCSQDHEVVVKPTRPEPKNLVLKKIWDGDNAAYATLVVEHSRPTIGEADYRGVIPSGYSSDVRYLEYVKLISENETSKLWRKYCVYVVPVDFVIQVSMDSFRDVG